MKRDTAEGLDPEIVARLLGVSFDSDIDSEDENIAAMAGELLEAHLAISFVSDTAVARDPKISTEEPDRCGSVCMGGVLTDSHSHLEMVKRIRAYAKQMTGRQSSEAEKAVATTIYFASIANALAFHDRKLTTHSYESLEVSFRDLAGKLWMPDQLIDLFVKARKICQSRR